MNLDFEVDIKFNKGLIFLKKRFMECNFLNKCSLSIKNKKKTTLSEIIKKKNKFSEPKR
jgi:hypothetical protein